MYMYMCLQQGDICPPAGSRKRRSVTNETNYRELELSYNLRVNDEVPEGERHEEPPKSQPQDDFNDYVRIKMAAFYGIIAFFVLALAAAILASCFLFKKAIIAGKKTGFRGKGGHSNPSYHA